MMFCRLLIAALIVTIATPAVRGQTPQSAGTAPAAQTSRAVQSPPIKWKGTLAFNGTLDAGEVYSRMIAGSADLELPNPKNHIWVEFQMLRSSYKIAPVRITTSDRTDGQFMYEHPFNSRLSFVTRDGLSRDEIRRLDYRAAGLAGVGIRFTKPKIQYLVTPGMALIKQNENSVALNGGEADYGLMHRITIPIGGKMVFSHRALIRVNVQNSHEIVEDSQTSLAGKIGDHWGLRVMLLYNYENVLAPPAPGLVPLTKNYVSFSPGIQYQF